ncbi:MAG: hypothetical protein ACOC7U_08670 [Spirochaetota bacterium]
MKKMAVVYVVFLMLVLPCVCLAENNEAGNKQNRKDTFIRKDPILAGALSWYVPGLGQLYAGAYFKGAAFWVVEQTLLVSILLKFAEMEPDVTGGINLGIHIKSKDNPDREEQKTAVLLGTSLVVVHFLNIIDAVNTTRMYNREKQQGMYTDLSYDSNTRSYQASVKGRF